MLRWALLFFIVALVASVFGFGGLASFSADMGKTLLSVFLVLLVIGLAFGAFAGNSLLSRR